MDDPLALDAETMRRFGYRTVDLLVERLTDPATPPLRRAAAGELTTRLGGPPPDAGEPFEEVLDRLAQEVLPFASRTDHPGFFAFVPGAGTWPGALGDFVASALNVYAGSWMESAGPSTLELEVLRWFEGWLGYGEGAAGVLTTGGSAANLAAFACARQRLAGTMTADIVAYVSDQGHSRRAGRQSARQPPPDARPLGRLRRNRAPARRPAHGRRHRAHRHGRLGAGPRRIPRRAPRPSRACGESPRNGDRASCRRPPR